jgi:four helix bundle protein
MDEPIRSYQDLRVWREAMDLVTNVYRFSRSLPKEELYGLTFQMRRSAVSIPANIAEGYGREHRGSYAQHLRIAQGSLKELETHLLIVVRIELADVAIIEPLSNHCDQIGKMLRGLIRSVDPAT